MMPQLLQAEFNKSLCAAAITVYLVSIQTQRQTAFLINLHVMSQSDELTRLSY